MHSSLEFAVLAIKFFTRFAVLAIKFFTRVGFSPFAPRALASLPLPCASRSPSPAGTRSPSPAAMASGSDDWMAATERRINDWRNEDIEGSGLARWSEAEKILKDYVDLGPSRERSQMMLNEIRKDLGSKRLFFEPHRTTFVVEGRPVQVHIVYRLLQGSSETLVESGSPSEWIVRVFQSSRGPLLALLREILRTFLGRSAPGLSQSSLCPGMLRFWC